VSRGIPYEAAGGRYTEGHLSVLVAVYTHEFTYGRMPFVARVGSFLGFDEENHNQLRDRVDALLRKGALVRHKIGKYVYLETTPRGRGVLKQLAGKLPGEASFSGTIDFGEG
jgi:hypothetical protein